MTRDELVEAVVEAQRIVKFTRSQPSRARYEQALARLEAYDAALREVVAYLEVEAPTIAKLIRYEFDL